MRQDSGSPSRANPLEFWMSLDSQRSYVPASHTNRCKSTIKVRIWMPIVSAVLTFNFRLTGPKTKKLNGVCCIPGLNLCSSPRISPVDFQQWMVTVNQIRVGSHPTIPPTNILRSIHALFGLSAATAE